MFDFIRRAIAEARNKMHPAPVVPDENILAISNGRRVVWVGGGNHTTPQSNVSFMHGHGRMIENELRKGPLAYKQSSAPEQGPVLAADIQPLVDREVAIAAEQYRAREAKKNNFQTGR